MWSIFGIFEIFMLKWVQKYWPISRTVGSCPLVFTFLKTPDNVLSNGIFIIGQPHTSKKLYCPKVGPEDFKKPVLWGKRPQNLIFCPSWDYFDATQLFLGVQSPGNQGIIGKHMERGFQKGEKQGVAGMVLGISEGFFKPVWTPLFKNFQKMGSNFWLNRYSLLFRSYRLG